MAVSAPGSPERGGSADEPHEARRGGRRTLAQALVLVLALAALFVVLPGRGGQQTVAPVAREVATSAPERSDRPAAPDDAGERDASPTQAPAPAPAPAEKSEPQPALVERMLDELRSGERVVEDDPNAGAPPEVVQASQGGGRPLGSIAIPSLGLDVAYAGGVHDAVVEQGPGHWPGTPLPGTAGNAVLSGHRTTFTKPFADLDQLVAGDEIATTLGPRDAVTYTVTGVAIVPEAEYVDFVLQQPRVPDARQITLFACHPEGQRTHRIVVRAEAPPVDQSAQAASLEHAEGAATPTES